MRDSLKHVISDALSGFEFFLGESPVVPAEWVTADSACRVALVLGSNGGGKSLVRRLLQQEYRRRKVEVIHISMMSRTSGGMARMMVYGSEEDSSTGQNSAHTITGAITTCRNRSEDHVLLLDEPDVGMSDEAAMGAGLALAEFCQNLPEHTKGVVITSHNRLLVNELLVCQPHYLGVGKNAPESALAWVNRKIVPVSPEDLQKDAIAKWREIEKIINQREKARNGRA